MKKVPSSFFFIQRFQTKMSEVDLVDEEETYDEDLLKDLNTQIRDIQLMLI